MSDKNDDERCWESLPREIKLFVYSHLREAVEKYTKDRFQADILAALIAPGGARSPLATTNGLIAEAFDLAEIELKMLDPDICQDCGGYHDPEEPTVHKKDLS